MRVLLLLLSMPLAVSMRARDPTAQTREPSPNAHSLLDSSTYNVAQAAVPKWLKALVAGLALVGGARADQNHVLLNPAEPALYNAGLMYNVEVLHNMPPTTGSPALEYNRKQFEMLAQLPDDQKLDAIQFGQYGYRVDPPKYTVSKEGQKFNQKVFDAFEAMAEKVVRDDEVRYSETATPADISGRVIASMDQVDKYLSFLEEPEHKEPFQVDWSKRATGSHERKERQTQLEFVVHVAESTLAHFSDAKHLIAGDFSENVQAQAKATKSLRILRNIVQLVTADTHRSNLHQAGYKRLEGPEHHILERLNKLLVPKKDRLSTYAENVQKREDLQFAKIYNKVMAEDQ